ncbi:Uncharacterised protein [Escherichia coli]|uniref:Uncharacterized protein n=1 Tax=Escherichia coli TaxID=562 RepID=A0A484YKD7_ECOLX|nr:Uncharacterised protein [Escherichia coli]
MSKRNDITDGIFATTKKYGLVYTEELGLDRFGACSGTRCQNIKKKIGARTFFNILR